jgi:hypothetical protein
VRSRSWVLELWSVTGSPRCLQRKDPALLTIAVIRLVEASSIFSINQLETFLVSRNEENLKITAIRIRWSIWMLYSAWELALNCKDANI